MPGASAIQTLIDRSEWAQQAANPAAYAPFVARPIIIQFARGDKTVPNPTTSAILRAGGPRRPGDALPERPREGGESRRLVQPAHVPDEPDGRRGAVRGRGAAADRDVPRERRRTTIDPDGDGPFFETPTSMVPEDLAYIP